MAEDRSGDPGKASREEVAGNGWVQDRILRLVAQDCILLYRGFAIRKPFVNPVAPKFPLPAECNSAIQQIGKSALRRILSCARLRSQDQPRSAPRARRLERICGVIGQRGLVEHHNLRASPLRALLVFVVSNPRGQVAFRQFEAISANVHRRGGVGRPGALDLVAITGEIKSFPSARQVWRRSDQFKDAKSVPTHRWVSFKIVQAASKS